MPLRRAFVSLVLVMAVLVAGISAVTIFTCVNVQNQILESVTDYQVLPPQETEDEYNLVIADNKQIVPGENGQLVILSTEYQIANLSDTQRVAYYAAKAAVVLVPTLLFVLGTIFCAWMFYSIKLKQPLSLLLQSTDHISQSDLDFCLDYPASDEMGELCRAMDTMRAALLKNNKETWAMIEERRKLSASIAHDLRTPITVMKGYTEYLSHNVPLGRISEDKLMGTIRNLSSDLSGYHAGAVWTFGDSVLGYCLSAGLALSQVLCWQAEGHFYSPSPDSGIDTLYDRFIDWLRVQQFP